MYIFLKVKDKTALTMPCPWADKLWQITCLETGNVVKCMTNAWGLKEGLQIDRSINKILYI